MNDSARSLLVSTYTCSHTHMDVHTQIHTTNKRSLEAGRRRDELWPHRTFKSRSNGWTPQLHKPLCLFVCVCLYVCGVLFVCASGSELRQLESGLCFLTLRAGFGVGVHMCACVCVDHLVGTVANFSIRHTHTIFSIHPKGQALFIRYCVQSQWVAVPLQADAGGL